MTDPRVELTIRLHDRWFARRADRTGTTVPDPVAEPARAALWNRQLADDVAMMLTELAAVFDTDNLIDRIGAGELPPHPDRLTLMLAAWRAESREDPA